MRLGEQLGDVTVGVLVAHGVDEVAEPEQAVVVVLGGPRPRSSHAGAPHVAGLGLLIEGLEGPGEVVVEEDAVGVARQPGAQHRLVAPVLVRLVALVAQVLDGQRVEVADLEALVPGHDLDHGEHRLVDRTEEADVGPVSPQTELAVGRPADLRHELHREAHVRRIGREVLADGRVAAGSHPLVGVDVEDPVAGREVERRVAGEREVGLPLVVPYTRAVPLGDGDGVVGRPGVDDDDLVDQAVQRTEARVEVLGLVADDDRGGQAHRRSGSHAGVTPGRRQPVKVGPAVTAVAGAAAAAVAWVTTKPGSTVNDTVQVPSVATVCWDGAPLTLSNT